MLSILIPEYNYDCTDLVRDLSALCAVEAIPYEILILDDCSDRFLEVNRELNKIPCVRFIESKEHLHSARIRNRLSALAVFDYLLFLDCDLKVVDKFFIRRYLQSLNEAEVLIGAVIYQEEIPPVEFRLRWKYGRKRECKPASVRNKNPWRSFASANFCIKKKVFKQLLFDEQFTDYGHEDTLFGLRLKEMNVTVKHLDNPLFHKGLDENERFLEKSLTAVSKYCTHPQFQNPERSGAVLIFRVFNVLKKRRLTWIPECFYFALEPLIRKNLTGANPNLILFDLYRLGYLCKLVRKYSKLPESV